MTAYCFHSIDGVTQSLPKQEEGTQVEHHSQSKESQKKRNWKTKQKRKKVTTRVIQGMKARGEKITMLTAYDALFAQLLDEQGVEMLLVGDSLGMVIQGAENTLSVTMEDMIYHSRCVARGSKYAMVVTDLPFMSYQQSSKQALINAGRLVQEGGAHAVKLEGAGEYLEAIQKITHAGIPVVGHLGLTPQSYHAMGGFVIQGRTEETAEKLLQDALAVEEAGAIALVLEGIPAPLAAKITAELNIPTIGIGAGKSCDGQVLVLQDMLGLTPNFQPKFVKAFGNLGKHVKEAVDGYKTEVKSQDFPTEKHSFF